MRPLRSVLRISLWMLAASLLFLVARAIAIELDSWLLGIAGAGVAALAVTSLFGGMRPQPAAGRG